MKFGYIAIHYFIPLCTDSFAHMLIRYAYAHSEYIHRSIQYFYPAATKISFNEMFGHFFR